jgi:hypothetical protein
VSKKDRNIMISALKRRKTIKAIEKSLHAALNNYARILFRHEISSSQKDVQLPSGAWFRDFGWFPHKKALSCGSMMKGIHNRCL